jgi:hypothetical protein
LLLSRYRFEFFFVVGPDLHRARFTVRVIWLYLVLLGNKPLALLVFVSLVVVLVFFLEMPG